MHLSWVVCNPSAWLNKLISLNGPFAVWISFKSIDTFFADWQFFIWADFIGVALSTIVAIPLLSLIFHGFISFEPNVETFSLANLSYYFSFVAQWIVVVPVIQLLDVEHFWTHLFFSFAISCRNSSLHWAQTQNLNL